MSYRSMTIAKREGLTAYDNFVARFSELASGLKIGDGGVGGGHQMLPVGRVATSEIAPRC